MLIRLRKKAQITLPGEIIRGLSLQTGDLLDCRLEGEAALLFPAGKGPGGVPENGKKTNCRQP